MKKTRADLKRNDSASYLTKDIPPTRRHAQQSLVRQGNQPTAPFQKENPGEFVKYSQKLTQSHYILAEEVSNISTQAESKETSGPKKNNYDFLKKSQIYNKKESTKRTRTSGLPKELNLTRITE